MRIKWQQSMAASVSSERLEQYFIANEVIDDSKKRAILLSNCGPHTYQLLKSLLTPAKPTDELFAENSQGAKRSLAAKTIRDRPTI